MSQTPLILTHAGQVLKLYSSPNGIAVESIHNKQVQAVSHKWWNVVWVQFEKDRLQVDVVRNVQGKTSGRLHTYSGSCNPADREAAQAWRVEALRLAYPSECEAAVRVGGSVYIILR